MATSTISEAQKAQRRRALGRRLVQKASGIQVDLDALQGTPDLQHLSAGETKALEKQLKALGVVRNNFYKLGEILEKS